MNFFFRYTCICIYVYIRVCVWWWWGGLLLMFESKRANRADPQIRSLCLPLSFVISVCCERRARSRQHISRRRCRVHLAAPSWEVAIRCSRQPPWLSLVFVVLHLGRPPKSSPSTVGCPKLDFPPNGPLRVSGGFSHVFATESACECSLVHVNGKEEEEQEEEMVLFRGVFCVLCLEICKLERDVGGREGMQGISPRLTLLLIQQDS